MDIDFEIRGLDEIQRKMSGLTDKAIVKAMRRALRRGANVVRNAARENAKRFDDPETRKSIYKNISVASGGAKRERKEGGVVMRVGMRGGARFNSSGDSLPGGNTTGYWRMLEFGTATQPSQPFLRPAMANNAAAAIDAVVEAADKEIDKELAKL